MLRNWPMTIAAVVIILGLSVVALLIGDIEKFQAYVNFAGPSLVALLALIQAGKATTVSQQAVEESQKTNKTLNGSLTQTVETVVHDVLEANGLTDKGDEK